MSKKITTTAQLVKALQTKLKTYQDTIPIKSIYFDRPFVERCIQAIETLEIKMHIGHEMSPLERLAIEVLISDAGIDKDIEPKPAKA